MADASVFGEVGIAAGLVEGFDHLAEVLDGGEAIFVAVDRRGWGGDLRASTFSRLPGPQMGMTAEKRPGWAAAISQVASAAHGEAGEDDSVGVDLEVVHDLVEC